MSYLDDYPVALMMLESVPHGSQKLWNVTDRLIKTWKHSTRRIGGYWLGSGDYSGSRLELDEMFLNGVNRQIIVKSPSQTIFEGYVAAMTYVRNGIAFERKLTNTANAIKSIFTRIGDNLLSNGSAESSAWTVYNGATVTQSTTWVNEGAKSCKIVVADTTVRGARISGAGYAITVAANTAYNCVVSLQVDSGSWRVSVNKSTDDTSLGFFSTHGKQGQMVAQFTIPDSSTYAGTVDFRITSEGSAGTVYGDGAIFQLSPVKAETKWYTDDNSIDEFGRIEQVLLRGSLSNAAANAEVSSLLARSAWFRTSPVAQISVGGPRPAQPDKLSLIVSGFVHTLANRTTTRYGTASMSATVTDLVTNAADFVTLAQADSNTSDYTIENRGPLAVWNILSDIATAGDDSGDRWSLGVYNDRELFYTQTDISPQYAVIGGALYNLKGSEADPRLVQPAMIRYDDMPIGPSSTYTTPANDPRYQYIDEVEFEAATGKLNFRQSL